MPEAKVRELPIPAPSSPSPEELLQGKAHKERLGPWLATSICGNDITSSILYVSGTAIMFAHFMAPVALLLVGLVLYLYRKIYTEVVEALPLDGGVYNCLLNSTRKFDASFAACLTLLSYMATAVISAKTAAVYLHAVLPVLPVMVVTAVIIIVFAGLNILGITDSARVALVIFLLHLATLTLFILWANAVTSFADSGGITGSFFNSRATGPGPCSSASAPPCWGSAALKAPLTTSKPRNPASFASPCAICGWPSSFLTPSLPCSL